jgi:hypothetical protein
VPRAGGEAQHAEGDAGGILGVVEPGHRREALAETGAVVLEVRRHR